MRGQALDVALVEVCAIGQTVYRAFGGDPFVSVSQIFVRADETEAVHT
jgi:hypothetical protein